MSGAAAAASSPLAEKPVSAYLSSPTDELLPENLRTFNSAAGEVDEEGAAGGAPKPVLPLLQRGWVRWALLALVTITLVVVGVVVATRMMASNTAEERELEADLLGSPFFVRTQPKYVHNLTLPVRLQWNENFGYCGSTSMVMAGMYFGAYVSMYDNRFIASNGTKQHLQVSQLLLGVNDYWAAHQHKLTNELWDYGDRNVHHFLAWIKSQVLQDRVVILGVYENGHVFDFKKGDADYDHIVPVTGWGSQHPLDDPAYYDDDVIFFSDNGLYTPERPDDSVYYISSTLKDVAKSRKDANLASSGVYSINGAPSATSPNFAISITGIVDEHNDCLPTSLTSDRNYESPEIREGSDTRPTAMAQTITATARGLTVGAQYNMYMYDAFEDVPSTQFNANKAQASKSWSFTADKDTWAAQVPIRTDQMAIFRTVLASAP